MLAQFRFDHCLGIGPKLYATLGQCCIRHWADVVSDFGPVYFAALAQYCIKHSANIVCNVEPMLLYRVREKFGNFLIKDCITILLVKKNIIT